MKKNLLFIVFCFLSIISYCQTYTAIQTLNVRVGKGVKYEILGTINKGEKVEVSNLVDNWGEINFKEQTAFVSMKFLEITSEQKLVENKTDISKTLKWIIFFTVIIMMIIFRNTIIVRGFFKILSIIFKLSKDGATTNDLKGTLVSRGGTSNKSKKREVYCSSCGEIKGMMNNTYCPTSGNHKHNWSAY